MSDPYLIARDQVMGSDLLHLREACDTLGLDVASLAPTVGFVRLSEIHHEEDYYRSCLMMLLASRADGADRICAAMNVGAG